MSRVCIVFVVFALLTPFLLFSSAQQETTTTTEKAAIEEAGAMAVREYVYYDPGSGEKDTVKIGRFFEAPMLAEMVKAGELPPVEVRLPEEPYVIKPIEKIGKYGGTAYSGRGVDWHTTGWIHRFSYEFLITYTTPYLDKFIPNVAKEWTSSADGKTFTFYLRKGMKWMLKNLIKNLLSMCMKIKNK